MSPVHVSPLDLLWGDVPRPHGLLNLWPHSLFLDTGSHVAAAGARTGADSGTPTGSGGPGEASSGVCARGCGLLTRRHDPAHERRWDQCGHRAATESRRCLSSSTGAWSGADEPFLVEVTTSPADSFVGHPF